MCICLPNGKFNFKFSRSYPCLGKKDSKHKHNLNLIPESSEEEEVLNKPVITNSNGVKKDASNSIQAEYANHQGHYRQLSRDRQLPPVPGETSDFSSSQINFIRKGSIKQKNKCNDSTNRNNDEYGSISESETYGESKSQSPIDVMQNHFKLLISDEIKEVDPLYASVIPQIKRSDNKEKTNNLSNIDNDKVLINNLNDHGYAMIMKKSSINEFNSLRKPERPKVLAKEHCHQSLQSLNNIAPGLPLRQYKQSELCHLLKGKKAVDSNVQMREPIPSPSSSNKIRRFSQPPLTKQRSFSTYNSDSNRQEEDVLKSLQSAYNTPPIKRASLTNLFQLDHNSDNEQNNELVLPSENIRVQSNENITEEDRDSNDFYRKISVRESLASLRERNALPIDSTPVNFHPSVSMPPTTLQQVYEGLYETLYYSSADNGRNLHPVENNTRLSRPPTILPSNSNPLPYLGQDNYLSITENPLAVNFYSTSETVPRNGSMTRAMNDRSSVVYTAIGSDVYAEISDVYQSKQYEELPENKQSTKVDGGQINNGFIGCSSPGSVRVMLEIQSFRHMDSDVDISSRCTTPLHPFGKPTVNGKQTSGAWKTSEHGDFNMAVIRHPWYLPQKSSHTSVVKPSATSSSNVNKPLTTKPKMPQNSLAIMTPLMERSMEGSSMFLDENKNSQTTGIDCLYDLFKQKNSSFENSSHENITRDLELIKHFLQDDSSSDENNLVSASAVQNHKGKRITYPRFSGSDLQKPL